MRIAYRVIIICGVVLLLAQLLFSIERVLFLLIIEIACAFCLVFGLIITFIMGLVSWRKSSGWWMGPSLLCAAFILSALIIGRVNGNQFKKHMDDYVKVVDLIKSGAVPCGSRYSQIDVTNLPPHISSVWAARCPDGSLFVEFNLKPHIPQTSRGYLFESYTETNNCLDEMTKPEHRYRLSHIADNWYEFRN
jgi:hypothetical protein